jgi:ABC-type nitrate/sulfonate/bicarbonate transport system substrate-binding protein
MTAAGIDKRFGLKVTVVPISTTGGQFLSLRGGAADVASGSVLDLLRQRKQGLAVQAFGAFQRFVNPIITTASSPVKTFAHLAGKQVGTPSTTLLDWLITRAAGKKAYGVDLGTQATPVPASTILLNQLLTKGQLSGALQFASLAGTPVAQGKFRELTTVPDLVKAAGFNTNSFYTLFIVSDSWVKAHPGGLNRLQEAMAATYQLLMTQTSPWTALAGQVGITQPAQITAYMKAQRASFATTYGKQLLQPTTDLLNSLISITGAATVGVSHVDPNAFVFPTSSGSAPW